LLSALLATAVVLGAAACGGGGEGGADDHAGSRSEGDSAAADTSTSTTSATPAPSTTSTTSSTGSAGCTETRTWTTGSSEAGVMFPDEVYLVRPGRHACFDRVVFDVNGVVDGPDAVGFHVAYVDGDVQADGSGEPVPTAGDAALEVIVRAPAQGTGTTGHQPGRVLARLGDALVTADQVAGWRALREVAFAGSFEGQTTFAVGVDGRLPFRAGSFEADGYTHVYVDVAHP
jgi:hypothetical protein